MHFGHRRDAAASRTHNVLPNGTGYWKSTFIRAGRDGDPQRPNGFLVEQDAGTEIRAHFHQSNQFQVFVQGSGRLGKHAIAPVTVHYASAFSPYGPILSDEDGLHYYTLRDDHDPGARFLPGAVAELQRTNRRYATSEPSVSAEPASVEAESRTVAIPCEADGLGAIRIDAPADARVATTLGPDVNDRYVLVLSGAVTCGERRMEPGDCLFLTRGERPDLEASGEGASVLLMQFPAAGPWRSAAPV